MSKEDMRKRFRADREAHGSILGRIADGARKVAGIAVGTAVTASAVKHTVDIVTGKARPRPPLLHPWGSMMGLAGALSFYELMMHRASYFNHYIRSHYRPHMHHHPIWHTPPFGRF